MNRDPRVDAYIARAQPFARPILEHVRDRVQSLLPNAEAPALEIPELLA